MNRGMLLLCVALSTAPLAADDGALTPEQFAQGFALEARGGSAIYRLRLDEPVYRATERADLADLAVFNGADEPVPQAFEPARPAPPPAATEQPLAFYPLPTDTAESGAGGLHVTVDAAGAVVSIDAPAGTAVQPQRAGGWIVDAGEQYATVRALRLQWATLPEPLVVSVSLRASRDLQQWRPVAEFTLAELEHAGHRLRQDTIEIVGVPARFLRIDAGTGAPALELQAIVARVQQADSVPAAERRYSTLHGRAASAPDTGWVFDTGGPFAVDRLRVHLPGDNNLAELRAWSRAREGDSWTERGSVLAYRLSVNGARLENAVAALPQSRERYWRLDSTTGDRAALGADPVIELGWQPDALLFLARGEPPFTLAVGSATRSVRTQAVAQLLGTVGGAAQQGSFVGEATLGPARTLGGEAALEIPAPPVPWQRYLMWAVLVAGVVVLLRMALSLLRSG